MKLVLSLISFVCVCISMDAQPMIEFKNTICNMGTFHENKVQYCKFVFINKGDKPLVIHQAYAACGCTVAKIPENPIAPGETSSIKVAYNGKGKPKGKFKRPITIRSNATNASVRVYIQGYMELGKRSEKVCH